MIEDAVRLEDSEGYDEITIPAFVSRHSIITNVFCQHYFTLLCFTLYDIA